VGVINFVWEKSDFPNIGLLLPTPTALLLKFSGLGETETLLASPMLQYHIIDLPWKLEIWLPPSFLASIEHQPLVLG